MKKINIHRCEDNAKHVFIKQGFDIQECTICGFRFTQTDLVNDKHVSEVYSDNYFFGGADGYSDYLSEKDLLVKHGENYAKTVKSFIAGDKMFDVGAAAGFLMKGFENEGWKVKGVEPNSTMVMHAKETLGLDVVQGSFETMPIQDAYDLVTMIQVIGHFYDLSAALDKARSILNPNGYVLIESWNYNSLYAKLMGKNWHEYSPPSVLNWFSKESLNDKMNQSGFKLVKSGYPIKKIDFNHALGLLSHKYSGLKTVIKLMEKIVSKRHIVLPYPPLDVFWSLYRKT